MPYTKSFIDSTLRVYEADVTRHAQTIAAYVNNDETWSEVCRTAEVLRDTREKVRGMLATASSVQDA